MLFFLKKVVSENHLSGAIIFWWNGCLLNRFCTGWVMFVFCNVLVFWLLWLPIYFWLHLISSYIYMLPNGQNTSHKKFYFSIEESSYISPSRNQLFISPSRNRLLSFHQDIGFYFSIEKSTFIFPSRKRLLFLHRDIDFYLSIEKASTISPSRHQLLFIFSIDNHYFNFPSRNDILSARITTISHTTHWTQNREPFAKKILNGLTANRPLTSILITDRQKWYTIFFP